MAQISEEYVIEHFSEALEKGYILPFFQPIYRSVTNMITCAEALARWIDPEQGMISPGQFIPVLEKNGLIFELDMEIIRRTCAFYNRLNDRGTPIQSFSVNLSRQDFVHSNLYDKVCEILDEYNVPHDAIKLEITESLMMEDIETFRRIFSEFKGAGFSIWIDDFGSGYSSLNMLQNFNFDVMKFDMLFLHNFTSKSRQVMTSLISMAKSLGIHTLTEGVETKEQQDFLLSAGCESLQGFYFAKPLSEEDLIKKIEEQNTALETSEDILYWNQIGLLSFLSARPLEEYAEQESNEIIDSDDSIGQGVPLALIECTKTEFVHIYANPSYMKRIKDLGFSSLEEIEIMVNDRKSDQYMLYKKLFSDAIGMGTMQKVEYRVNDVFYRLSAKCLARREGRAMIALRLSTFDSKMEEKTAQEMINYCNALFSTYELVVLFYPDSGVSNRIYTSEMMPEYDREKTLAESAKKFCESEVLPIDQERYMKFIDFSTMGDRLAKSNKGFIQGFFRMRWGDEVNKWFTARITQVKAFKETTYVLTIQAVLGDSLGEVFLET